MLPLSLSKHIRGVQRTFLPAAADGFLLADPPSFTRACLAAGPAARTRAPIAFSRSRFTPPTALAAARAAGPRFGFGAMRQAYESWRNEARIAPALGLPYEWWAGYFRVQR
jgi:hypothetical protein